MFTHYQIETQIETAFQREVRLPSGGSIVIDPTEAMISIDINSARATKGSDIEETAFNTNLEAAEEVARQLRLRDAGGLVVIDFIDMTPVRHQREVENRMRDAVRQDRARIQLGRISRFGLLEMSRQRLRPSIGETSQGVCPRCNGTGQIRGIESLALSVLRLMEEEAIKDNTQQVQAQVPVPVATYLLNEKRRAVFHIETQHKVNILIIPNPNMVTPQYEVLRVKKDESIEEASYDISMKQAAIEEAVMPKFDKEASKRDEPLLQTMSAAKQAPKQTAKVSASTQVKTEKVESKSLLSSISTWIKSLFSAEEEVKPAAPKTPQHNNRNNERNGERRPQRNRQGQRRNNRNANRNDNRKPQDVNETKESKQTKVAKPQKEAVHKPKEEKVAERRQRRNNRKKVRRDPNEQANAKPLETATEKTPDNKVQDVAKVHKVATDQKTANIADNNSVENNSEQSVNKTKDEQRPRSRRSPRHMRANGQRRRQNADTANASNDVTKDPVTARYPEQDIVVQDNTNNTDAMNVDVKEVDVKETAPVAEANESATTVDKTETEVTSTETAVTASVIKETIDINSDVQQNLPFDEPESAIEVKADVVVAEETPVEIPAEETTKIEPKVEVTVEATAETEVNVEVETETVVEAPQEPISSVEAELVAEVETTVENVTEISDDTTSAPAIETEANNEITEQAEKAPKKVRAKEKNIKRKVKAASNKAPGKASAPMTKPETIVSHGVIPTAFVTGGDRLAHSKSEKIASVAHATSRHSAGPTKPSLK